MAKKQPKTPISAGPAATSDGAIQVDIENVGPIPRAQYRFQPGHVNVLRGVNGVGKSTVIEGVEALAGRDAARLTATDGEIGGSIKGGGATITITRSGANRRSGEFEVIALDDGIGLSRLVDPGVKEAGPADGARIKILASMFDVQVTDKSLAGHLEIPAETLGMVVSDVARKMADPVQKLEKVKRELFELARTEEALADQTRGRRQQIAARVAALSGVKHDQTLDQAQAAHRAAVEAAAKIKAQRESFEKNKPAWNAAEMLLEQLGKEEPADVIEQRLDGCTNRKSRAEADVRRLENELAEARHELRAAAEALENARGASDAAEKRRQSAGAARSALATRTEPPTEEELDIAEAEVERLTEVVAAAREAEVVAGLTQDLEAIDREIAEHVSRATKTRDQAGSLVKLLVEPLNKKLTTIEVVGESADALRVTRKKHKRGRVYFGEMSPGERWADVAAMAIDRFREQDKPGLMTIEQEAWEALDFANRQMLRDAVAGTDLIVITAEAIKEDTGFQGIELVVE